MFYKKLTTLQKKYPKNIRNQKNTHVMKTLKTTLKLAFAIGAMMFASQAIAAPIFAEDFQTRPSGIGFGGTANWTNTDRAGRPGNEGLWEVVIVGESRFARILPPFVNSRTGNNAWLISNSFALTQGEPVLVTFRVRRTSSSALQSLRVHIGTSRAVAIMETTTPIWQIEDLGAPEWINIRVRFVPLTTGNHFIGFNARSPMHNNFGGEEGGIIFLDDIEILSAPNYDLGVERVPFQHTQVPEGHIPPPVVKITNTGLLPQTNVVVSGHVNGEPVSLPAIPSLEPGQTVRVGFPAINKRIDTLTTISVASAQVEFADTFSADTLVFIGTHNVLAQDAEVYRVFFSIWSGINRPGDMAGMVYEFAEPTNISQIVMLFAMQNRTVFRLDIYALTDANTVNPTPIHSEVVTRNGQRGWQAFDINLSSPIPPGRYFIAVNQELGTYLWFLGDGNLSRFYYERERGGNRIMPVQRTHLAENVGAGVIGGLVMRLVTESTVCTPATNLAVDNGPGSAEFTWTPSGMSIQALTLMRGTDTIHSTLLGGQVNRLLLRDMLIPEQTNYSWSIVTHCDATNSLATTGPMFDAKACQIGRIVVDDSTLPHGINFEDDIFLCLEQNVRNLSINGDSLFWQRSATVFSHPPSYGFQLSQRTVLAMGMGARASGDSLASTKLILPTFDLSGITDDPMLRIRRAATRVNSSHVADTLSVFYRTSPTEAWRLLAVAGNATDDVTEGGTFGSISNAITLELQRSPTLQIALQGTLTASGGGVYVDSMYFFSAVAGELLVEALSPAPEAGSASVRSTVTARFNRNIRVGPNFEHITVVNYAGESYKVGASISQATLTIHTEKFFDTTFYTVHIPAGAVQNMGGGFSNSDTTWSFTTGREPLQVDVFTPLAGQVGVLTDTEISMLFGNNVVSADPDSLKKITLRKIVTCPQGDTLMLGDTVPNITFELDGRLLRLVNPEELQNLTTYRVTVPVGTLHHQTNEIRPVVGGQWIPWQFTTIRATVFFTGFAPEMDQTNVALDAPVWMRFNRNILPLLDSTLLDEVSIREAVSGTAIDVEVKVVDNTLYILREADFHPNTRYTITIPLNFVGNDFPYIWSFTTGDPTGIQEQISHENAVLIFPNPVSDMLHIKSQEPVLRVEIFNLQGQLLRQINEAISELSVSELNPGTYILRVTTAAGVVSQRFVKQ